VVSGLTLASGALYALGCSFAFQDVSGFSGIAGGIDARSLTGATVLGLSMFATLFLGTVLAGFLVISAVRGDAERGLLQPLVVRPVGRDAVLMGRLLGAVGIAAPYTFLVYSGAVLVTGLIGDWWPQDFLVPGLELAGGVVVVAALGLLGSVFLTPIANGIAVFMVFGAGLVAGLLGQIGDAINSERLEAIGNAASWALPFEALYQDALSRLISNPRNTTELVLTLGPFGGAQQSGGLLIAVAAAYLGAVCWVAIQAFRSLDL
jgi:ABC-type transport system involved in multi-copper enzyme maturation permease subunit